MSIFQQKVWCHRDAEVGTVILLLSCVSLNSTYCEVYFCNLLQRICVFHPCIFLTELGLPYMLQCKNLFVRMDIFCAFAFQYTV
jgi:hypothetical protein